MPDGRSLSSTWTPRTFLSDGLVPPGRNQVASLLLLIEISAVRLYVRNTCATIFRTISKSTELSKWQIIHM